MHQHGSSITSLVRTFQDGHRSWYWCDHIICPAVKGSSAGAEKVNNKCSRKQTHDDKEESTPNTEEAVTQLSVGDDDNGSLSLSQLGSLIMESSKTPLQEEEEELIIASLCSWSCVSEDSVSITNMVTHHCVAALSSLNGKCILLYYQYYISLYKDGSPFTVHHAYILASPIWGADGADFKINRDNPLYVALF